MRDRILFTRLDKKLMLCNLLFGPTYITPRIELGSIYPYCMIILSAGYNDWDQVAGLTNYAYNGSVHSSTGFAPF